MKRRLVYLASPYSHPNKAVEHKRYKQVTKAGAIIKRDIPDVTLFLPITQSYHMVKEIPSLGGEFDKWKDDDLFMVNKSDELWVLLIDGWDKSIGVKAEIEYATKKKKKIRYIILKDDDLYEAEIEYEFEHGVTYE